MLRGVTSERTTTPTPVSRLLIAVSQVFAPQDKSVFDRLGVVGTPDAGDREPEALVEQPGGVVGPPYLERGPPRTERGALLEDALQQRRGDAGAAELRQYGQIVDVQLVEHTPERAEPRHAAVFVLCDKTERDTLVLELREIHLTRPRIGERRFLDDENRVDLLRGR